MPIAVMTYRSIWLSAMLSVVITLLASCGWKGEPIPDISDAQEDTVYNDKTYTAVTGKYTALSAVGVSVTGYVNGAPEQKEAYQEFGFLVSRFVENPSMDYVNAPSSDGGQTVRKIPVLSIDKNNNSISCRIRGLLPFTRFYFRTYVVKASGEVSYGVVKSFKTLQLSISMGQPSRVGLLDADLVAIMSGITQEDYGDSAYVSFRCTNGSITQPSDQPLVEDPETTLYDKVLRIGSMNATDGIFTANFNNFSPGDKYSIVAYVTVCSDFYKYSEDNPTTNGVYLYGSNPTDVRTDHYATPICNFTASALTGVSAFVGRDVSIEYDFAQIKNCYFTLPIDTLVPEEYGIDLCEGHQFNEALAQRHVSQSVLRLGNKFDVAVSGLSLNTKYCYKSYVRLLGLTFVSVDVDTFSTRDYTPNVVDLGLSVLWADRNIGAYDPEHEGSYFAWGEAFVKGSYTESNYSTMPTEASIAGTEADVATVKWGAEWRMPTTAEVNELFDDCEWKWTSVNGVVGYLVTGSTENSIFLPAGGIKSGSEVEDFGTQGYYWTAEAASVERMMVNDMYVRYGMKASDDTRPLHQCKAYKGLSVRPVRKK